MKLDEGYFFGLGCFETIAVEEGIPMLLEAHLARLERAMDFLGISQPMDEIRQEVQKGLAAVGSGRRVLKLTVSQKNILVNLRDNHYTREDYLRGMTACISPVCRNETSPFTYHKTLNYGDCILEKRRAAKAGIGEPIFCNTRGEIAEGAVSNVFFVRDGELYTPPVSCGMLPGIVRQWVMDHVPVREQVIVPEEAGSFQEMFLTNSLMGVMPVAVLGETAFPENTVSLRLARKFFHGD